MSAPVISRAQIVAANGCSEQVALFDHLYPTGEAVVTRESVAAAAVAGLDVSWGADYLLKGNFKRAYDAAIAEPRKAYAAAIAEPRKAYAAAMAEAEKAHAAAMAEPFADAFTAQWQAHEDAFGYPHEVHLQPQSDALLALGELANRLGWNEVPGHCVSEVDGYESTSDADTKAIEREAYALKKAPVSDLLVAIIKGLAKQAEEDAKLAARIAAKAAAV